MRFQLNGSVEITFKTPGETPLQSLYFEAEEFSRIDDDDGIGRDDFGAPIYSGVLDAVEDNIQVRLRIVADRSGFREKIWEILTVRQDVIDPTVASDRIAFECLEVDTER